MDYKYENVESVEAKKDFPLYFHDENGEVIDTIIIKKGTKGVIESMGCNSVDYFRKHYDVCFQQDDSDIDVCMWEENMEEFLILS